MNVHAMILFPGIQFLCNKFGELMILCFTLFQEYYRIVEAFMKYS